MGHSGGTVVTQWSGGCPHSGHRAGYTVRVWWVQNWVHIGHNCIRSEDKLDKGLDLGSTQNRKLLDEVGSPTLHFVDGQKVREEWDLPGPPAEAQMCPAATEDRPSLGSRPVPQA